jgi:hypothetical protein
MNLQIQACTGCGAHYFPARLRCPRCSASSFAPQPIAQALVTGVVPVHRFPPDWPWRCLVELRTSGGVTLIAAAAAAPTVGAQVRVAQQPDGAVVVSPI